jgi:hypothetical protein
VVLSFIDPTLYNTNFLFGVNLENSMYFYVQTVDILVKRFCHMRVNVENFCDFLENMNNL